jgi:hypothetical protein
MFSSTKRVIAPADAEPESRRTGGGLCHQEITLEADGLESLQAVLSKRPNDIGANFYEQTTINLAFAVAPFVLDQGHRRIDPLRRARDLARQLDQTQRSETSLSDSSALRQRSHITVERYQDGIIRFRGGAYQWVGRSGRNCFA